MKVIYYVAASLDGFIADGEHGVAWLDQVEIKHSPADYENFFAKVDGVLMGRKTYDFIFDFGTWPYEDRPAWVISRREVRSMDGCNLQAESSLDDAYSAARDIGLGTLWVVGGGNLVAQMIATNQLTHVCVSVMPIMLGNGIPLLAAVPKHVFLRQQIVRPCEGYTQIEYELRSS